VTEKALILFAHGARDPEWARPVEAVATRLRQINPDVPVLVAFLEFMTPTLPDAVVDLCARHMAAGRDLTDLQIDILPFFIAQGGHVRRDVPEMLNALAVQYPDLKLRLLQSLGELPEVQEAMASAISGLILA
jgi:sirohydrochlorin cobaltochelatase